MRSARALARLTRPLCGCDEPSTRAGHRPGSPSMLGARLAELRHSSRCVSPGSRRSRPVRSGIASYSAMVLPALAARHDIALFVGDDVWAARRSEAPRRPGRVCRGRVALGAASARRYDFAPLHRAQPFDLVVYQLGNAGCHDYMWPYLTRYPGLVVLHDAQLHQSRAHALIAPRPGGRPARRAALRASRHAAGRRRMDPRRPGQPRRADLAADRGPARRRPRRRRPLPRARGGPAGGWPGLDVHVIRHGSPDLQRWTSSPG